MLPHVPDALAEFLPDAVLLELLLPKVPATPCPGRLPSAGEIRRRRTHPRPATAESQRQAGSAASRTEIRADGSYTRVPSPLPRAECGLEPSWRTRSRPALLWRGIPS